MTWAGSKGPAREADLGDVEGEEEELASSSEDETVRERVAPCLDSGLRDDQASPTALFPSDVDGLRLASSLKADARSSLTSSLVRKAGRRGPAKRFELSIEDGYDW